MTPKAPLCAALLCLAAASASTAPAARAELLPGTASTNYADTGCYELTFQTSVIGHVLVIDADSASYPPGFTPGREYWAWQAGPAWRGAFRMAPIAVEDCPGYTETTWESFPHAEFDLSDTVPFPNVTPGVNDHFYEVHIEADPFDLIAFLWVQDGAPRQTAWWGVDLTAPLIDVTGTELQFNAQLPPAPGSLDVYLLD